MASRGGTTSVTLERARSWWLERQALASVRPDGVEELVAASGWLYAAGASGPYLSLWARQPSLRRRDIDRAIYRSGALVESPAVRGCTMLVPAADLPIALRAARAVHAGHLAALARACRVERDEIDALGAAVAAALATGPATPEELRGRVPGKLVRALGEAGRRLGDDTTLAVALKTLQADGVVRRASVDGRLDSTRFAYRLAPPRSLPRLPPPAEDHTLAAELVRRFLGWAAPATAAEIAFWSGLSLTQARTTAAAIHAVRVAVPGFSADAYVLDGDLEGLRAAASAGRPPGFRLVPFRDNFTYFRRAGSALVAERHLERPILDWRNRPAAIGTVESLHHHAVLEDGRVAGIWEVEPDTGRVVTGLFEKLAGARRKALAVRVAATEAFLREEDLDLRTYALDGAKNRARRLAAVRALEG